MRYEYRQIDTHQGFWFNRLEQAGNEGFRIVATVVSYSSRHVLMEREVPDESSSV